MAHDRHGTPPQTGKHSKFGAATLNDLWQQFYEQFPGTPKSVATASVYSLRTVGKGTFEWGAKIKRIWMQKCAVSARKDLLQRVGVVAIFLNFLIKLKSRCLRKEMALS